MKYVILGTSLGFLTGGISFLPVYGISINPLSTHFIWLYTAVISYAIVKHGLLNINIILRKGLTYTLLVTVMTATYFAIVFVSSMLFQNLFGYRSFAYTFAVFMVFALCFKPLESIIQDVIDRHIFKRTRGMLERENELLMREVLHQDRLKAVATLAAGMAHEIKNPITAIKTFAQYLPEKYDDPQFREKFQRIVPDEVDRINHIVTQLLEFSKPQPPTFSAVDIESVADETLDLLANNLLKSRVTVQRVYGSSKKVRGDRNQLKQVFLNIFLNAIQAMPGGGELGISTQDAEVSGHKCVIVKVSDTGRGIPKEDLTRIFDPFFSGAASQGTGLGLSIVHNILSEHAAQIRAESAPGTGTTFTLTLRA